MTELISEKQIQSDIVAAFRRRGITTQSNAVHAILRQLKR